MKTTNEPTLQEFQIENVKHIHPSDAFDALISGEAVMIDVRETDEAKLEIIPLERVLNHPMSLIIDRLPYIPKDQNIIVACPGGVRSTKVAFLLMQHGYEKVASLNGGLKIWKAKGFPFESNLSDGGCECNSGASSKSNTPSRTAPGRNNIKNTDYKNLKPLSL